jgi:hypothetical protein
MPFAGQPGCCPRQVHRHGGKQRPHMIFRLTGIPTDADSVAAHERGEAPLDTGPVLLVSALEGFGLLTGTRLLQALIGGPHYQEALLLLAGHTARFEGADATVLLLECKRNPAITTILLPDKRFRRPGVPPWTDSRPPLTINLEVRVRQAITHPRLR